MRVIFAPGGGEARSRVRVGAANTTPSCKTESAREIREGAIMEEKGMRFYFTAGILSGAFFPVKD
jgi:hypothetical protein